MLKHHVQNTDIMFKMQKCSCICSKAEGKCFNLYQKHSYMYQFRTCYHIYTKFRITADNKQFPINCVVRQTTLVKSVMMSAQI